MNTTTPKTKSPRAIKMAERRAEAAAHAERMAKIYAENAAIVTTGKCPECGTKLYRNSSLAGWWQCGHYGAPGFQAEAGPHCSFQLFTK